MVKNEYIDAPQGHYNNVEEFIREFTNEYNDKFEVNWGIDFEYKGVTYHFCRYPMESDEQRLKFSKMVGRDLSNTKYELAILYGDFVNKFTLKGPGPRTTFLGWFDTIEDALNNTLIDNRKFSELICSSDIQLTGKD